MKNENTLYLLARGRTYASMEVCRMLDIKRITLQRWLEEGFIEPQKSAHGRGTRNEFTFWNVFQIKLFKYLIERGGLSRNEASNRIKQLNLRWLLNEYAKSAGGDSHPDPIIRKLSNSFNRGLYDDEPMMEELIYALTPKFLIIYRKEEQYEATAIFRDKSVTINLTSDLSEVHVINTRTMINELKEAAKKIN